MKKSLTLIAIVLAIIVGAVFLGTTNREDPHLLDVNITQINKNISNGSILVDVRTAEEYAANHANGATNIPLDSIKKGQLPDVAKNKVVYVYCHSGTRAAEAKQILDQQGFAHVISLTSLSNWLVMGGGITNPQDHCSVKDQTNC